MIRTILSHPFTWIDVVTPTVDELSQIAKDHGLHPKMVEDCLDPEHLPKFETIGDKGFFITRTFDTASPSGASSVQALTRKVVLIFGPGLVVTIHRVALDVIDRLAARWTTSPHASASENEFLSDCFNMVLSSYESPLEKAEEAVEAFEHRLFTNRDVMTQMKAIHRVKTQVNVFRRMLWHTLTSLQKVTPFRGPHMPLLQDLRENAEANYYYADDLIHDINALLNTQLAMASHRTNEIVRILTIFSVFFMPLTFIVGIYGMNFKHMPELDKTWGYPAIWAIMTLVTLSIFVWFRRSKFFK